MTSGHAVSWQAHLLGEALRQHGPQTQGAGIHLAVLREPFLGALVEGRKTAECRMSIYRAVPFGLVEPRDLVLVKALSGPVVASFRAAFVESMQGPTWFESIKSPSVVEQVQSRFQTQLCAPDDFFIYKASARYATVIGVGDLVKLAPITIAKRDRRPWVVLALSDAARARVQAAKRSAPDPGAQLTLEGVASGLGKQ